MMRLIIGLILSIFLVIFIFQNNSPVTVHFLNLEFSASLALLLLLTFVLGIILSILIAIPATIRRLRKNNKEKEKTPQTVS